MMLLAALVFHRRRGRRRSHSRSEVSIAKNCFSQLITQLVGYERRSEGRIDLWGARQPRGGQKIMIDHNIRARLFATLASMARPV
jgi:hypothetical protein